MLSIWNWLKASAQSDPDYISPPRDVVLVKERAMAFLIGFLAIILAFGVAILDRVFEKNPPEGAALCARDSISHYFHEPVAGTFFVIVLAFVGAFMIAYRGEAHFDGWLATIGGVGGLLLAFFPTGDFGCAPGSTLDMRPAVYVTVPVEQIDPEGREIIPESVVLAAETVGHIGTKQTNRFHFTGAAMMFGALFLFCLIVFPRVNEDRDTKDGKVTAQKMARNGFYYLMCVVMAVGLAMIVGKNFGFAQSLSGFLSNLANVWPFASLAYPGTVRPVYHGEVLFLVAFGASWLLKGRFWRIPYVFFTAR